MRLNSLSIIETYLVSLNNTTCLDRFSSWSGHLHAFVLPRNLCVLF